jgi:lipoprotein-anchoring transpeptidase ErfK/SrfK
MNRILVVLIFFALSGSAIAADKLTAESINHAEWSDKVKPNAVNPTIVKLEIMLARAHFSSGEIDGKLGENLQKAASAYAEENHLGNVGSSMKSVWDRLSSTDGDPAIVDYDITEKDVQGPFLKKIPKKMEKMKGLRHLSYRSPKEELAEKFHMSEELLHKLNPGKTFTNPNVTVSVAAVDIPATGQKAASIEVSVDHQTLKALDGDGNLIAYYPATVGSDEKPAPMGTFKVKGIAKNPIYHYNPKYAFKGVKSKRRFTIAAGPNNPVGTTWIDLSAKSYGIHGTPEPSKVSKSESHGCIRLTNWDVQQLAAMVRRGTKVVIENSSESDASEQAAKRPAN